MLVSDRPAGWSKADRKDAQVVLRAVSLFMLWLHAHPKWPAAKQWRAVLAKRRFRAVLHIHPSRTTGELVPSRETEAMLMEHTNLHPRFDEYLAKVEAELQRRDADKGKR